MLYLKFAIAILVSLPALAATPALSLLSEADIHKGIAVASDGPDFLFAVDGPSRPELYIDSESAGPMKRSGKGGPWIFSTRLKTGWSHSFYYLVDGKKFGGNTDVPAYMPDSYEQAGVPRGALSEKLVHTSRLYDGMTSDYWIYVAAQYDASKPAAVMVWQDGERYVQRDGATRAQIVFDNLMAKKKIPVMVHIFISPGKIGDRAMRSIEYDTVSDKYARFLRDEILPEVGAKYSIRKDGYSRGIVGGSSGGICAFNVAWFQNDQFSRVISHRGSFTSIQWHPGENDGGNVYSFKIRKETKRNIRVWLQDGSEDLENNHGSWPLQNLQMANSLKLMNYDFHLSFGNGTHNPAHPNSELPEELTWLWRDYDYAKTNQTYEMDPAEKDKPLFRVKIYSR